MWAVEYGYITGAAMWGAHIGLAFFTVIRHGGFYMIVVSALTLDPLQSACLFGGYWLGRVLPIWLMPILNKDCRNNGEALVRRVLDAESELKYLTVGGLLATALAAATIASGAHN
jgi:hypothetical protein